MHRVERSPGVYAITDTETGEILIFTLYGKLPFVRVFEMTRRLNSPDGRTRKSALADYVPSRLE